MRGSPRCAGSAVRTACRADQMLDAARRGGQTAGETQSVTESLTHAHRIAHLEHPERPQDQRGAGGNGTSLHCPSGKHRQERAVPSRLPENQPEQPHPRDHRSRRARRSADQRVRVGRDSDLSGGEDRQIHALGYASESAGAGVADVANGRLWPDARSGAPTWAWKIPRIRNAGWSAT